MTSVSLDDMADRFVRDIASRRIRFIANEPDNRDKAEYREKIEQIRADNDLPAQEDFVFVEVTILDPSEFEAGLTVRGEVLHGRYRVLTLESSSIPTPWPPCSCTSATAPAAPRTSTSSGPRATLHQLPALLPLRPGRGRPVTREVLREAEPDRSRRPRVHVG